MWALPAPSPHHCTPKQLDAANATGTHLITVHWPAPGLPAVGVEVAMVVGAEFPWVANKTCGRCQSDTCLPLTLLQI